MTATSNDNGNDAKRLKRKMTMVLRSKNVTPAKFEAPEDGDTAVIETTVREVVEEKAAPAKAEVKAEAKAEAKAEVAQEPVAKVVAPVAEAEAKAETSGAAPTPVAEAAPASTSTAVALKPASATLVGMAKKFQPALVEYEKNFDPAALDFNTFNRITVSLDGFEDSEGNDLGKEIRIKLMSYNSRWVVTPGVQDAEATELVRYSVDGKYIDGTEQSVHDYLAFLKNTENYDKAAIKEYLAVFGFLTHASHKEGKELVFNEIPPEDQSIVELQVPPMSRPYFTRYQIEAGVKISSGVMQPSDILVCRQEKVDGKTQKYANIKFASK